MAPSSSHSTSGTLNLAFLLNKLKILKKPKKLKKRSGGSCPWRLSRPRAPLHNLIPHNSAAYHKTTIQLTEQEVLIRCLYGSYLWNENHWAEWCDSQGGSTRGQKADNAKRQVASAKTLSQWKTKNKVMKIKKVKRPTITVFTQKKNAGALMRNA